MNAYYLRLGLVLLFAGSASGEWIDDQPWSGPGPCAITIETDRPVRVIARDSNGQFADGAGRGLYVDGRFFAEDTFTISVPPGPVQFELQSGPHFHPLSFTEEAQADKNRRFRVRLKPWFSPETYGWFAGDNHVHTRHGEQVAVKTDLAYTALQGRANGLQFITEAGSHISYKDIDQYSTPDFLLRHVNELRPGPYVGHLITPGIAEAIPEARYKTLVKRPLPAQAVFDEVRRIGGVT
ncbi:MAG: hypothetical protein AAF492_06230, partial [Verrucomicrobiota bacterium]